MRIAVAPHPCQHLRRFDCSHRNGCEIVSLTVLICISLMAGDVEHLFLGSCWPFAYLLWRNVHSSPLAVLKIGLPVFFVEFASFFMYCGY